MYMRYLHDGGSAQAEPPGADKKRVKQNTLTRNALRSCKNQSQRIKFKASKSFQLGNGKF